MERVLVKWSSNWADEMDIEGFSIMKSEEWESYKKKVRLLKNFCVYIGTNEEIDYASGEDLLEEIVVRNITPAEEKTLKKLVGANFGHNDFLFASAEEDDEETSSEIEE